MYTNLRLGEILIRFVLYGILGFCVEIVYTAIIDSFKNKDWRLAGTTYLWMFPIYGLSVFLFEPVHDIVRELHLLIRFWAWSLGITFVEFFTGWMIKKMTGLCPWDYSKSRFAINEYIRWDYFPLWGTFGLLLEFVHDFFVLLSPAILKLF
ncbi:MAG: hypothetical protein H7A23_00550 [Leptospiraceae bacterium]|nr:hypothetical protein [Leptospiraceae bacterium]MCP5493019.1 hypothetical protein [Leptospiraceae bacterium]